MLTLQSRNHIHWLLANIEVVLLVASGGRKVEVSVYKRLGTSVKQRIDVALVPTRLFDWLKFAIEIIKPLTNVSLRWLKRVIPWGIIESDMDLEIKLLIPKVPLNILFNKSAS